MNLSCWVVLQAENRRADLQPHEYENPSMKKKVIVLGSTGSIGRSALEVLAGLKDDWDVVGLAAGSRWRQLADQAVQLQPRAVAITDEANAGALESSLNGQTTVMTGADALVRLVDEVACDCVVSAVVGTEGLPGVVFVGIRTPQANNDTDGLTAVTALPDLDFDGRNELMFGFPNTDSRGHNVSIFQNGVRDPTTLCTLEKHQQFLRGGVVIVSSKTAVLQNPDAGFQPVINLDEVGQMFSNRFPFTDIAEVSFLDIYNSESTDPPCQGNCIDQESDGIFDAISVRASR
ncbi:MAG: hypothetical protein IIB57_15885, partial [Planctomycetes bacterium]|nr:hypothetical protein [Planctomycetota bacterium]